MSDQMASDPTLRRWYMRFNDVFFGGELPLDIPVYWEPATGNLGETFEVENTDEGESPDLAIRLDPCLRFSSMMAKLTLIHEMAHVRIYPYLGHGKPFDAEIKRLCGFREYRKLL